MKKALFILLFFTIVTLALVSISYSQYSIIQITDNSYDDRLPQINDSGYVVWYGSDGSDDEIFLYDGTGITQITNNSYGDVYPQINDSGYIVWYGWDGSDWEIFLAFREGTINSGRIAFHSYTEYDDDDKDGIYSLDGEIHIYNLDSNTPYTLAQDKIRSKVDHAMNPKFSRDGSLLVFMGLPKNDHPTDSEWYTALDIFMYSFRTNQVINLSDNAGLDLTYSSVDEDPTFSPDGTKVVFKRDRADLWEISLLDNYSKTQLTNSPTIEESGPQYSSPDGDWILFWVGTKESAYIAKMPSSGGALEVVHDNPGVQDYYPSYWGDDKIIYTSWGTNNDDDIKIYYLEDGPDVPAEFNTPSDDSDPFPLTENLIGFSTMNGNPENKWNLWYGDPLTGDAQRFDFSDDYKHDIGGSYTPDIINYPPCHPADTNCEGCIDMVELMSFIARWENGEVSMEELMEAITLWKIGCGDFDGDGLFDYLEDKNGNVIFEPELGETDPFDADTDDDGLVDGNIGSEDLNANGIVDPGETDPLIPDTDGDGLPDGLERGLIAPETPDTDISAGYYIQDEDPTTTTDPTNPDTDGDCLLDGEEDFNKNGKVDPGESNPGAITGSLNIDPDTLNLKSKGKWITAYIELPEGYSVEDISEAKLEGIEAEKSEIQVSVLMAKFSRKEVIALIEGMGFTLPADVDLKVTGQLNDATPFEGIDTIRVIKPEKK